MSGERSNRHSPGDGWPPSRAGAALAQGPAHAQDPPFSQDTPSQDTPPRRLLLGLASAGLSAAKPARPARRSPPAEEREFPFDAQIPGCQDAGVLEKITYQFAEKEAKF